MCPDPGAISRSRISLDAAIMQSCRNRNERGGMIRVGWIGSSPLLGYKLLVSRTPAMKETDLSSCFEIVTLLITDSDGILKASAADLLDEVEVEPYVPMWEKMEISVPRFTFS